MNNQKIESQKYVYLIIRDFQTILLITLVIHMFLKIIWKYRIDFILRYVQLMEKDVLKFGFSSREYVMLHDQSKEEQEEDPGLE